MDTLDSAIDAVAHATRFSGTVRVDDSDGTAIARAYGLANRRVNVPNTVDTQFAIASGTKGFTALVVVSLIADGAIDCSTSARSILGNDLPLIADDVTIGHLLAHTSGIGDYLDEDLPHDLAEEMLPVPAAQLTTTEDYLSVLGGHPTKFPAGTQFSYSNSGYVVLALIAERATGEAFPDLVDTRVCKPAGLCDTAFLCADELSDRAALGYLAPDGARTNALHLPRRGSGDGGIYTTAADIRSFWEAFVRGKIVSPEWVEEMVRPQCAVPRGALRYGLGFWLHPSSSVVMLEGCDAGVSFRSVHDPLRSLTHTVISNTTDGAWPVTRLLDERLGT